MSKLFLKIFLWFWLALALVWAGFLIPTELNQGQEIVRRFRALHGQRLILSGRTALAIHGRSGQEGLQQWIDDLEGSSTAPYPFVLDENLQELAQREPPEDALTAARAALAEDDVWMRLPPGDERGALWVGRRYVSARSGQVYALVQRLPSQADLPPPSPWLAITRWMAMLLTSGFVCYALARYLVSPVTALSYATRRFAEGDLDVRVSEDLSRRRDELGDLGTDFDSMAERIGLLLRNQRQLLSDISHELRSPLARLYVALGLARKRADAETGDALDRIERETERLNELIGQLLSITKMEGEEPSAERHPVRLRELVTEIVNDADFEARSQQRGVDLSRADDCVVLGFEELMRRAIENVVRNAVHYTSDGTRVDTSLTLRRDNGAAEAVIEVRDRGPGVPEDQLDDLFRPFYRLDGARGRASGGTGLGLAISDRAVRLHGGHISARNSADGGLIVEIAMPARQGADPDTVHDIRT